MTGLFQLMRGDCLERLREVPDGSVDMVLADLPYQVTACKWDVVIPFEPMWEQLRRVCKKNAAIVLTASQPFTSALVMSNMAMFKYEWVWEKSNPSNIANCNKMVMKYHENIAVFYSEQPTYNPQKEPGKPNHSRGKANGEKSKSIHCSGMTMVDDFSGIKHPKSIIRVENPRIKDQHPTQKPVALGEYLIRTYTNEGEVVLDCTMGSGTFGVSAANTGRRFIGIELDEAYYKIATARVEHAYWGDI